MKKLLTIGGFLALCGWFAGFAAFAGKINDYQTDETTKTDAIVVLTGGRNRISEAVRLWDKGLADKLFISGVEKNTSLDAISKRQAVTFTRRKGILLDRKSTNTIENAIETRHENHRSSGLFGLCGKRMVEKCAKFLFNCFGI